MIDSSQPNFDQLLQLLQTTLVGCTQQIRDAQQNLKLLSKYQSFLPTLMMIPKEKSMPYNLRKAAIIYIGTYIKNLDNYKNQEKLLAISKFIFTQLSQPSLEIKLRRYLINSISILISYDKSAKIKYIFYQQCMQNLLDFYKILLNPQNCSNIDGNRIIYIGLAIQTILTISIHITKQLNQFIKSTFMGFIAICEKLYEIANENIAKDEKRDSILQIFQMMRIYSYTFKLYMKKITYSSIEIVKLLFEPAFSRLLEKIWQFSLKDNQINTTIIFYSRSMFDQNIVSSFHSIKADYTQCLGLAMRIIFQFFKDPITLSSHPLIKNVQLVSILISSIYHLFLLCSYYKIRSPSLEKLIEQILNTILITIKSNYYYEILGKVKKQLVEGVIFKILQFSSEDLQDMINDPQEFIHSVLQIIQMDNTEFLKNRKKQGEIAQEEETIENYTTLKTIAATSLLNYCKNIDGTLNQLLTFIQRHIIIQPKSNSPQQINVKIEKSSYSKSLLFLVLGILRDLVYQRISKQEVYNIIVFLTNSLQTTPVPPSIIDIQNTKLIVKQNNLQYAMHLMVIMKYITKIPYIRNNNSLNIVDEQVIPKLYKILTSIITTEKSQIEEIIKIMAYQMITIIIQISSPPPIPSVIPQHFQNQIPYSISFMDIILAQLNKQYNTNTTKLLQILFNIYKYKSQEIQNYENAIKETLISCQKIIEKEINNTINANMDIINKSWHIITDICSCEWFVSNVKIVEIIENILYQLTKYLQKYITNDYNNSNKVIYEWLQYEDHILSTLNCLLQINKTVTPQMIEILKVWMNSIFYHKNKCIKFEGLFQTLGYVLEYGSKNTYNIELLTKNSNEGGDFISIFINLVLYTINISNIDKSDFIILYAQNFLLLQNIIMAYGNYLPKQAYNRITSQLFKKIQNPNTILNNIHLKGHIICLFALILMVQSKNNLQINYTNEDINVYSIMLSKIIENRTIKFLKAGYKVTVMSLSELLGRYTQQWISNRLVLIIQCILDILKLNKNKQNSLYGQGDDDSSEQFEKQQLFQLKYLQNISKNTNETQYFKEKIMQLKKQNNALLQNIIRELPEEKVGLLKEAVTSFNIGSESRQIFKIKR